MKKFSRVLAAIALVVLLLAGNVMADTINSRPFIPATGDLSALQNVFTGINSSINVLTDQSNAAIFEPTGFGSSAAAFIAQVTWEQSIPGAEIEFGLYDYDNPLKAVTVIPALATPLTKVTINFDFLTNTVTTRTDDGTLIDSETFTDLTSFGFYTYTAWNGTGYLFSEDSLNPSGSAQQLIYEANGDYVNLPGGVTLSDIGHWYVACEGLAIDGATTGFSEGSFDFNDMVVMLESVKPVPEPTTMLLLGLGLFGIGIVNRRKK